ncbi:MAG: hypothetical protein GF334_08770 [Candidatus Altiarchaeales archaeon]|nr:hypothetical protein [Candidatus Altiarchaeales archaeon]
MIRYCGLVEGKPDDKFLVPAIGFRGVSGLASAAAYAIAYHFHREGVEVNMASLKATVYEQLQMVDDIHSKVQLPLFGLSYAFHVEERP